METAFQADAFQTTQLAFQIAAGDAEPQPVVVQREIVWGVPVVLRRRTPELSPTDDDWIVGLM